METQAELRRIWRRRAQRINFSASDNDVLKVPTFPFSNLLTLFLQLTSHRSPVSPWSPIRFRNTDASVPLPPTVPVQTVTLYLITAEQKNATQSVFYIPPYSCFLEVNTRAFTYRAVVQGLFLHRQGAPSQPRYRLHSCPASAHKETHTSPSLMSSSESPNWRKAMLESLFDLIMRRSLD